MTDEAQACAPTPDDADALGALLLVAYRHPVDDEGETLHEACAIARELFAGVASPVTWEVSELTWRDGRPVAAALVTRWHGHPLLAQLATAPDWQRRGLAGAGRGRVIGRLGAGGETVLRLVVTQGNAPAKALYESLGLRPEAQPPFTAA